MSESTKYARSWEEIGPRRWVLCRRFGDSYKRRVVLECVNDDWRLSYWYQQRSEWSRCDGHGWIAELEGDGHDVEDAKVWALKELSSIARDRAIEYAGQSYALLNELVE